MFKNHQMTPDDQCPVLVVCVRHLSNAVQLKHQCTNIQAIPDPFAQVMVAGMNLVHQLGVKRNELIPISQKIRASCKNPPNVIGGLLLQIEYEDETGEELCYIYENVETLLLSKTILEKIRIITEDLPLNSGLVDTPSSDPSQPWEKISASYFTCGASKYLLISDKLTKWVSVYQVSRWPDVEHSVNLFSQHFNTHGVSIEVTTDGGLSPAMKSFFREFGVYHRTTVWGSSEIEKLKQMILLNTDSSGILNSETFSVAIKAYRDNMAHHFPIFHVNVF